MSTRGMNFKMDEAESSAIREVASVFHMTMTDVVREAVREYIERLKADPFYRLTANVEDASADESAEILAEIESMSDEDLKITTKKEFAL